MMVARSAKRGRHPSSSHALRLLPEAFQGPGSGPRPGRRYGCNPGCRSHRGWENRHRKSPPRCAGPKRPPAPRGSGGFPAGGLHQVHRPDRPSRRGSGGRSAPRRDGRCSCCPAPPAGGPHRPAACRPGCRYTRLRPPPGCPPYMRLFRRNGPRSASGAPPRIRTDGAPCATIRC